MSLVNIVKRIYDTLTQPLYNRLLWELKSGLQTQLQAQLDSQADLMEQVLDELSTINQQLEELRETPAQLSEYLKLRDQKLEEIESGFSSETICSILTELRKARGLQYVMHQYDLTASAAMLLDCKYHGMNAGSIERVRQAAKQGKMLEQELKLIQAYKAVETTSTPL